MSKRKQSSLLSFINKTKTTKCDVDDEHSNTKSVDENTTQDHLPGTSQEGNSSKLVDTSSVSPFITNKYDIGNFVRPSLLIKSNISDDDKYRALKNIWVPDRNYLFPLRIESGQQRKFNIKWLEDFQWLSYSHKDSGAYCLACVLFGPKEAGEKNKTPLGKLVLSPLNKYKHALEIFKDHANKDYHKSALLKVSEFVKNFENPQKNVAVLLDTEAQRRICENRKRLYPIIKTIILCGTENIPLRGHRDDGELNLDEGKRNEGKFRALLRFRVDAGDKDLEFHLRNSPKNASFLSKTTQNNLIDCCGKVILDSISEELHASKLYSIIADETRDCSSIEQLTICLRYLDFKENKIKEMFIGFVEAHVTTGEELTKLILQKLQELNLDLNDLRGQAYDGGSNMSGKFKGVRARIQELNPLALYIHCASHQLNLALSHASSHPSIRNTLGVVSDTVNFVRDSSQRMLKMKIKITDKHPEETRRKLITLCETRFVERHDSLTFFLEVFDSVVLFLAEIEQEKPSIKSAGLLSSVLRFDFIITLHILGTILDITATLSRDLQSPQVELHLCYEMANTVVKLLTNYRLEPQFYDTIFQRAVKVASEHEVDVKCPRIVKRQVHRSNIEESVPQEYYRKNVFIPFVDHLISELSTRFSPAHEDLIKLFSLIPSYRSKFGAEEVVAAVSKYCKGTSELKLLNEMAMWQGHWKDKKDIPTSAIEAFSDPFCTFFPNIKHLLHLICVLPVTSCSGERSFSTMKLTKTYLRSTMSEERLNGLALMCIHKHNIPIEASQVIEKFATIHPRRLQFLYSEHTEE